MKNYEQDLTQFLSGMILGMAIGTVFGLWLRGRSQSGTREDRMLRLLHKLENDCKKAVENEDYERAAVLRDRIRSINNYLYNSAK